MTTIQFKKIVLFLTIELEIGFKHQVAFIAEIYRQNYQYAYIVKRTVANTYNAEYMFNLCL